MGRKEKEHKPINDTFENVVSSLLTKNDLKKKNEEYRKAVEKESKKIDGLKGSNKG